MPYSKSNSAFQMLAGFALVALIGVALWLVPRASDRDLSLHPAPAQLSYQGKVVDISDGDSLTIETNNQKIKIRLAQIDAPERGQPWGQKSRQALAQLVDGKTVVIFPRSTDRYGRIIAEVHADGLNVNNTMVAKGAAWSYPDYVTDEAIVDLETQARNLGRGLWAMPTNERVPPWEYRKQRREAGSIVASR